MARAWSGTQHVVSVRDGHPSFTVLELNHQPGVGSAVHVVSSQQDPVGAVASDNLDAGLLTRLSQHYELSLVGMSACVGRPAQVVEARRRGVVGPGAVAGRFWVDRATHLVLRREVLDSAGAVTRSSAFVSLKMSAPVVPTELPLPVRATGRRLDEAALEELKQEGWPVIREMPEGMALFEARLHDETATELLQLAYSDGLSTMSLFVQRGQLAADPAGIAHRVGNGTVWVTSGSPERAVWSGGDHTWTLVSDAPSQTVAAALEALPHVASSRKDDGVPSRVWRGMSRVGRWLNPFD